MTAPALVISQVYGGGGNSGATYRNDFVEIFNPGTTAVDVTGWSVQYASSSGTTWQGTALSGVIPAGGYYLVQQAAGTGGTTSLPTPDAIGTIAMSATSGKVILVRQTALLSGACPNLSTIVDFAPFGSANCPNPAGVLSNTTAAIRLGDGCTYTGNATADFSVGAPAPRNSASPKKSCTVAPPTPASITVSPSTASIATGAAQAFTATVRDAGGNEIGDAVTWSSSDNAVATVSSTGVATGVTGGSATITATTSNGIPATASLTVTVPPPPPSSADIVISQIYGGGGNSGATYRNDFIELYNRGSTPIDLSGWKVHYSSAAGTTWQSTDLSGTIQPNSYFLVQQAAGSGGTISISGDVIGTIAMGATAGKVLLTSPGVTPSGACPKGTGIVDHVGYGNNTSATGCSGASDWLGRTADLGNTLAAFRKNDGCVKTGNAASDFVVLAPNPRNSSSPARSCTQPPRPQSDKKVVINELMGDPANAESASWGEWFEVFNYGTEAIDLQGWTIISDGTSQPNHVITSSVVVPAGGYAVLGRGGDVLRNGGVTLAYNYYVGNSSTIWLDDSDYLMLLDGAGARVDSVAWTSLPRGVTKGLRDHTAPRADVNGANWGFSTTTFGDGDYGTPGANNEPLGTTAPYVSPNIISVSGRIATDAPLPVGFEAQLFATERDPSNNVVVTTFTWTSLTPSIASVDSRGVIRALAAGLATFRVTSANGTSRNHSLVMETPVASTTADYRNHVEFGEPADADASDDFLVRRNQYVSSFNNVRGIPNWVAYNLNATHIAAGQDRCNCFTFDPALEAAGFARYTTADYTGAGAFAGYGIDRGHLARSFDRTTGSLDNATTFYFSNIIPQTADQNQGPWATLENYLGDQARFADKEVYIYAGASGSIGTVKGEGRITIPSHTWKVAVIMPRGRGLADVRDYRDLEVVSVVMPNVPGIRGADWTTSFVVLPDSVEKLSGYTLLSALPAKVQRAVKLGIKPPLATAGGPYTGTEGSALTLNSSGSVDPNGTIVSYSWDFGDGNSGSGAAPTHTYALRGTYNVRLIAVDNDALADTAYTTVTVANVAPVVASFDGASLLPNETYSASGGFTDPGAGSWTATVDYGDGSGIMPLSLSGKSFSLSRTYTTPGTYTVTVSVSDGLATGVQSATVTVSTLAEALAGIIASVDALEASGKLNKGNANSLRVKLDNCNKSLTSGNTTAARNQLNAALNEIDALVRSGRLPAADGSALSAAINRVLASMGA
jgi:DNA/RNA endonuclease G (NUC1)